MPRTALVKTGPTSLNSQATQPAVTMAAADVANGNFFPATGKDLLVVQNTGGSPYHVTITTAPDYLGRTGDVTAYTIAAGAIVVFGPFPTFGFQQPDGGLYVSADNAAVKLGVVALP